MAQWHWKEYNTPGWQKALTVVHAKNNALLYDLFALADRSAAIWYHWSILKGDPTEYTRAFEALLQDVQYKQFLNYLERIRVLLLWDNEQERKAWGAGRNLFTGRVRYREELPLISIAELRVCLVDFLKSVVPILEPYIEDYKNCDHNTYLYDVPSSIRSTKYWYDTHIQTRIKKL